MPASAGAVLEPIWGSYSLGQIMQRGSFALGTPPTVFRDGTSASQARKLFSVVRVSVGLYTVSFAPGLVMPKLPDIWVDVEQNEPPTTPATAQLVVGSWTYTPGTTLVGGVYSFQVGLQTIGTTPAQTDGHAGDRVKFLVIGSITPPGIDPA